jgi:hypothetical protein
MREIDHIAVVQQLSPTVVNAFGVDDSRSCLCPAATLSHLSGKNQ